MRLRHQESFKDDILMLLGEAMAMAGYKKERNSMSIAELLFHLFQT